MMVETELLDLEGHLGHIFSDFPNLELARPRVSP
jgi:hypothetical protein